MKEIESLTRYVANFVDALAKSGLKHVVISPGSRSTPLAMTICEHPKLKEWIVVDERSAAYFALGIAKQTKKPAALLCTSGSAAANYYPAIIEAYYSRIPLVILTADRPHELRDVGASQAIDQIKMYVDHVKWFQEMPLPEATEEMLSFARTAAYRAVDRSQEGNAGPVQLNFPFREPLIPKLSLPNLWGDDQQRIDHHLYAGRKLLPKRENEQMLNLLTKKKKGLIVCGPQEDRSLAEAITKLAKRWKIPVLADPLSQIRSGEHDKDYVIENYDALFRSKALRKKMKPDFILRFGAMPVSKYYSFYAEEHQEALHVVVEPEEGFRQPTKQPTQFIYADPVILIEQWLKQKKQPENNQEWLHQWLMANEVAMKHIHNKDFTGLTEGTAVQHLLEVIPDQSILYVGNSMPIRDVDTFMKTMDREITVLANRGASGIEGLTSCALGVSATTENKVTLLIGDLSFYHDLNGLLTAKQNNIDLTIVLIHNNGGGIFSFLPQAEQAKHFEKLFGTPLNINFRPVIEMYGGIYRPVQNITEFKKYLQESYKQSGLHVIEVQTDRKENAKWHQNIWGNVIKEWEQNDT